MNDINNNGIWVIGDVHGESDKLISLANKLPKNANICLTGDLVDRGDNSSKVIELVLNKNWLSVLGNHELMMLKSMNEDSDNILWQQYGGNKTLISYEELSDEVWASHIEYLSSLPYFLYFEFDGYKPLVVSHSYIHHVWINKDHPYCEYDGHDILWRHMYDKKLFQADKELQNNIFNVFGHSPVKEPLITETLAMIDTGATYINNKDLGRLSAIHYPSLDVVSIYE
ncbi:metallophosphoesterase [Sulfurimonas sp.]|uniref:metallophosphoesterase n=1 Tax=Sulfurimonas sp. TaxID=2022749 RepID=UPI002AB09E3B|nr:metallophosphoesterase [Sulfurimonas sp.]